MFNWMIKKAVKMQKTLDEEFEKEMPEMYAEATGKPVYCSYCGAKNNRKNAKCSECRASLKE